MKFLTIRIKTKIRLNKTETILAIRLLLIHFSFLLKHTQNNNKKISSRSRIAVQWKRHTKNHSPAPDMVLMKIYVTKAKSHTTHHPKQLLVRTSVYFRS